MSARAQQAGFTFFTLLLWLIVGGFVFLFGMKLGPVYMENQTIQSVLNGIKSEASTQQLSMGTIRGLISKDLFTNGIRDFEGQDGVDIGIQDNKIHIIYERRVHIMGNVDAVMSFANYVELPNN